MRASRLSLHAGDEECSIAEPPGALRRDSSLASIFLWVLSSFHGSLEGLNLAQLAYFMLRSKYCRVCSSIRA